MTTYHLVGLYDWAWPIEAFDALDDESAIYHFRSRMENERKWYECTVVERLEDVETGHECDRPNCSYRYAPNWRVVAYGPLADNRIDGGVRVAPYDDMTDRAAARRLIEEDRAHIAAASMTEAESGNTREVATIETTEG